MVAVEGLYDNGKIRLVKDAPVEKARVIVVFPEDSMDGHRKLDEETARTLFDEFSGCLDGDIDPEAERLGAFDEKYADID